MPDEIEFSWSFLFPKLLSSSLLTFVDTFLSHHMSKRPAIPGITLNSPTHKVGSSDVLVDFV